MGKTVVGILTIGAAIAVNFIPGVGQVISGALGAAFSGTAIGGGVTAFGFAAAQAVTGALTLGITAFGLQSLGGLLGLGPNAPKSDTASTAIKTSRPPRVSAYGTMRLYGAYILYETADAVSPNPFGNARGMAVDGYAVHDGPMTAPVTFYIGDDVVTWKSGVAYPGGFINGLADGKYGNDTVRFFYTDGQTPGTTIPEIISLLSGIWTSDHRGDGICLLYATFKSVKSKNFLKRFPSGTPPLSIAAQWQKCPDPWAADPTDESGWTWTENVIRHLMHYKMVREGIDYATKIAPSIDMWRDAADVCDESVPLKAGGTEARYRSCISHMHTQSHAEVNATMLAACDGWMATRPDGSLAIYAGKYYPPTVTIGPENIVSWDWEGVGVDDDEAVNEFVCSYISVAHDYNSVECDAWRNEDDIAERGQVLSQNMEIQTPSFGQVRRLAKRKMARVNAAFRGTITTNVSGRIARGHRYITLNLVEGGDTYYSGPAEIRAVTRNMQTGGITFSWVSADPDIDAWNAATEEGSPAANGDRVAPQPLSTPIIDTATAEFGYDGTSAQIMVLADSDDGDDITWYLRWKLDADSIWNEAEYTDINPSSTVELLSVLVPVNAMIDIAIAYGVGDGRISDWSTTETVDTSIEALAPTSPTELTITGTTVDSVSLSVRASTSPRHAYLNFTRDTVAVSPDFPGAPGDYETWTDTALVAGPYDYAAVSYNSSNIAGSPTPAFAINVGGFSFAGGSLPSGASLTRSGTGWYFNSSGVLTSAATDTARFDYRWNGTSWVAAGVLVEPSRENRIRNSVLAGSTTGVIGSGGVMPTNGAFIGTATGITREVVGSGTEDGMGYVDLRISGTSSNGGFADIYFEATTQSAAAIGNVFTASCFIKLTGGTLTGVDDIELTMLEYNSGSTVIATQEGAHLTPTSTRQRFASTFTCGNASTAYSRMLLRVDTTGGATLDITLRLYQPQFELGSGATSPIPTSGAKVTRNADALALDWATGRHVPDGAMTTRYGFDDTTTQDVATTVASGTATVPTTLNRHAILIAQKVS